MAVPLTSPPHSPRPWSAASSPRRHPARWATSSANSYFVYTRPQAPHAAPIKPATPRVHASTVHEEPPHEQHHAEPLLVVEREHAFGWTTVRNMNALLQQTQRQRRDAEEDSRRRDREIQALRQAVAAADLRAAEAEKRAAKAEERATAAEIRAEQATRLAEIEAASSAAAAARTALAEPRAAALEKENAILREQHAVFEIQRKCLDRLFAHGHGGRRMHKGSL
jgi:hypothetical protein